MHLRAKRKFQIELFRAPPPQWGGLDLGSRNSGFARLCGGKVASPLGVVKEEVVVLIVLVRRHQV